MSDWDRWDRVGRGIVLAGVALAALGATGPAPTADGADLPLVAPQVPEEHLYAKIDEEGGRVEGRQQRRRDAPYVLWELDSGTVVRYRQLDGRRIVEDHVLDAAGLPTVTLKYGADGALAEAVLRSAPAAPIPLTGWADQPIPGGTIGLPAAPTERSGGGAAAEVLGGQLDVWRDVPAEGQPAQDPFSDTFRDGLVAGCGCFVVDRATTWIDGQPAVRYRLLVPGAQPRDAVDLWAVARPDGLWLMSFRVPGSADPVAALAPGRVLAALVRFGGAP